MSRGPGRWQRELLLAARSSCVVTVAFVVRSVKPAPGPNDFAAAQRAARRLAEAGDVCAVYIYACSRCLKVRNSPEQACCAAIKPMPAVCMPARRALVLHPAPPPGGTAPAWMESVSVTVPEPGAQATVASPGDVLSLTLQRYCEQLLSGRPVSARDVAVLVRLERDFRREAERDRLAVAQLTVTARRLVAQLRGQALMGGWFWPPPTPDKEAAWVAELQQIAPGRADLLAEAAGLMLGAADRQTRRSTKEYRGPGEQVEDWLEDQVDINLDAPNRAMVMGRGLRELFGDFQLWCEESGQPTRMGAEALADDLRGKGFKDDKDVRGIYFFQLSLRHEAISRRAAGWMVLDAAGGRWGEGEAFAAAELCRAAGADPALIPRWTEEGRRRAAAAADRWIAQYVAMDEAYEKDICKRFGVAEGQAGEEQAGDETPGRVHEAAPAGRTDQHDDTGDRAFNLRGELARIDAGDQQGSGCARADPAARAAG